MRLSVALLCLLAAAWAGSRAFAADPPTEWIDPDTGHRVIRLSTEPGSASLYFNQNAYTADGQRVIITTPTGLATINLQTRAIEQVVPGKVSVIVAGRKSGDVYYTQSGTVYAVNVNTKIVRQIAKLPARGFVATLNADETLLAGALTEGGPPSAYVDPSRTAPQLGPNGQPLTFAERKEVTLNNRLEQHIPMALFTLNTRTGAVKFIHHSTDWLNHFQFSPTDPGLLMFCHEGPWHKVDRIWTIRTDGSHLTKIHTRTMNMEIAGHEFWSSDGKTIWYDLQTPRGEDFWVAGYEVATGHRTWYHLQRDEWSVHYNVSPDGSLFAGDGGDSEMVAHAPNGKWIYLFRPQTIPDVAGIKAPNSENLIRAGVFQSERLVNMSKHQYTLEPNVSFTPDQKWLIFRSNMFGPTQVFAVEIAKAQPSAAPSAAAPPAAPAPRVPVSVPAGVTLTANIPYDKYPDTVLDIMVPSAPSAGASSPGKLPGVIMFHGGGWVESTKETMMRSFCLPYLQQGYVVCNVEYRLAPVAPAPAAVTDALDAAAWFFGNAAKYNVDPRRIVVTGASAGGHLALMVGMTPASANLGPVAPVAAIVDCYGPTDVADLVAGPHHKSFASQWVPDQPGRMDLAKRLSPLTYARKNLSPTFICQGANDTTVPVDQSVRLTQALHDAGVDVQMITVPGAKHGFSSDQWVGVHAQIFAFLKAHGVQP